MDAKHIGHDMHGGHHKKEELSDTLKSHEVKSGNHHGHMVKEFQKRFWICLVLTIPVLLLTPLIQQLLGLRSFLSFPGDSFVLFGISSVIFFYGGTPFIQGFVSDMKARRPGMMTLITVAIVTAYFYSTAVVFGLKGEVFFWELATLIDVMLLGHYIEMKSISGASRALEELVRLMPPLAHKVMPDGTTVEVKIEELNIGDNVLIKPGEKIPADGIVVIGETSVNEAMLTGESKPVYKKTQSKVIGGSINGEGSVTVEVRKTGADSFLSQVIKLVKEAQASKSKTQDLANKAAVWLTILALGGGLVTLIIWFGLLNTDFSFALERTVTVMVIACPHALGVAIPLVIAVSTAISARNGLLIRNRTAFEAGRNIDAIIFDKTGTLTKGQFGITDFVMLKNSLSKDEILKLAASVEAHSEHPIAKAVASAVEKTHPVTGFKAIPGKGAQATVNGKNVQVVSPGYLKEQGIEVKDQKVDRLVSEGKTVIFILIDNEIQAAIALADIIRPESKKAISALKDMGIKTMMLTGDNNKVAEWVSREIGLDEYFAEVLPDKKAEKVKEVQKRGLIVAMTGDGVNDAPALAQADVGIAIGAGTDVAIETADVILVRNDPQDVVTVIDLSKSTYKKMIQNLLWATGYNVIAIPLAAGILYSLGILLSPAVGAAFMSASTVIVTINARLLKL